MKQWSIVVAIFLNALVVNAQTIGVKLGTEVQLPTQYTDAVFSPKAGIHFDQPLIGRLGISVGAEYVYTHTQPKPLHLLCCFGPCPTIYKTDVVKHDLQIPVSVTFDVFRNQSRSWFGTLSYGFYPAGDLLRRTINYTDVGTEQSENGLLRNNMTNLRAPMHAGFEVRRIFRCNGTFAFGTSVTKSFNNFSYFSNPYPVKNISFYVKTGLNLKKKR